MRKFIMVAATTAIATLSLAGVASADVPRYQKQEATFTITQPRGSVGQWTETWVQEATVKVNPCDRTFVGSTVSKNGQTGAVEIPVVNIVGSFGDNTVTYTGTVPGSDLEGYLKNAPTDGETVTHATTNQPDVIWWDIEMKVSKPVFTNASNYKNHGQYVKAMGGGDDAAHSCIGMPISSNA